jgi:hypothetical protein
VSNEEGLRRGLLVLALVTAVGLAAELVLLSHWESLPQILPFVLSGLATLVVVIRLMKPVPATLWPSRAVFAFCLLGGAFGVFEHLEHNWEFAAEIDASATPVTLVQEAITGANPALAPGALGLLGLLGLLATWRASSAADAPPAGQMR